MAEPGIQLANMTWPEARNALAAAEVVIVPTGSTEQHGPGMLLRTDTSIAAAVAERVANRLRPREAHGARRVFLLNGHGGNQAALGVVVARARQELRVPVATALYLAAAADLLRERFGRAYAHACEIEASVALAAAPDLGRPEALAPGAELTPPYRH